MLPLCVKGSYRHGPLLTGRVLRWCLRARPSPGMMPCGTWGHLCACPGSSSSRLSCRVCTCQPDAIAVLLSPPHPGPPRPLFYPLRPRNASARLAAVFCPPAALAGWVASARPWVGGRSGAGRGGSGRSGRGIKAGLFLYCKVITRAFQSLICRDNPGAIGSLPEPGNSSPITHVLRQSPVHSHTWAHTGIHVLWSCQHVCASSPAAPSLGVGMGTPFGTQVCSWEGESQCQAQRDRVQPCTLGHSAVMGISVPGRLLELVGRFGSQRHEGTKSSMFCPTASSQGRLAQVSGRRAPFCTQPARLPAAWPWSRGPSPGSTQSSSGQQCQVSAGTFPSLSPSCCSARALLKNLFHSSRHRGGNDGSCLRQHLSSQGWGAALALPTRSWGWDGVWELVSPGMEARAWERFCLPPSVSTLVHTSSPAPCPKAGLGCSALLHGVRGFLCHSSPCLGTLWS